MIKYCERCKTPLGDIHTSQKYCASCAKEVARERDRSRQRVKPVYKPVKAICQWCGEPMVKMSAAQKYHKECAKEANFTNIAQLQRLRKEHERKSKSEKKIPSVGQVQALADKLGKHYGEVSQMLTTGELIYEW